VSVLPLSLTFVVPALAVTITLAMSLSVMLAVTDASVRPENCASALVDVCVIVPVCGPSTIGSSMAVTVTIWGTFHAPGVKVRVAGDDVTCASPTGVTTTAEAGLASNTT